MSKGERERKTSPDFNDISNIHADAFCCFVLSFLAASSVSPARRIQPSLRLGCERRKRNEKSCRSVSVRLSTGERGQENDGRERSSVVVLGRTNGRSDGENR